MEVNLFLLHNDTYNITKHNKDINNNNRSSSDEVSDLSPPLYIYIYFSAINMIVFCVGVVGNALVIQVVARVRAMRKRTNYFLVSLSAADLLVLLVGLPAALHEFYGKEKWLLGEAMCKIVPFLENASHHCSVLTLLAIGFERYYAICHPLRQPVSSRISSASIMIPAVWVLSCVVSAPFAILSNIKVSRYYDDTLVDTCRTDMSSNISRSYIVFISVGFLALPLLLLTVLYSAIIRTLRSSTTTALDNTSSNNSSGGRLHENSIRNARAISSRHQVVRMMIGVMFLYFVCLFPLRCVQLWAVFRDERDLVNLGFIGYLNLLNCVRILVFVNSAGNPIIYGLLSSNFRAAFRQSCFKSRSNQVDRRQQTTLYTNSINNSTISRQHGQGNLGRTASLKTVSHREEEEEKIDFDVEISSNKMAYHCLNSGNNCSENSANRALLNQTVSVSNNSAEVITLGYQQDKSGLTYV